MQKKDNISNRVPIICLTGPTASGKTALAIEIVKRFPCEIISVDSAMVYRHMDIGTAKPTHEILQIAPHRLIDLLDPKEAYSAGSFREDALREIDDILSKGSIPLLVGGTMLYFRVLEQGIAMLPRADKALRAQLQAQMAKEGVESLHTFLASIDKEAASRIHKHDAQRIQRALEVFLLTNKTMTDWQKENKQSLSGYNMHYLALAQANRADLHKRIAMRFDEMLALGFIDEVIKLHGRSDLTRELPSMRAVGYKEVWDYLDGKCHAEEMREKAIAATRQLAKRQLTWLRIFTHLTWLDSTSQQVTDDALRWADNIIS